MKTIKLLNDVSCVSTIFIKPLKQLVISDTLGFNQTDKFKYLIITVVVFVYLCVSDTNYVSHNDFYMRLNN